ncbi:MAG: hypothetical protein KJ063_02395 [Anaerolineae bacterium]|nr:hypothetical protein [Anaerolineae bacterium]
MALTSQDLVLAEISDLFDSLVVDGTLQANLDHPPLAMELEGRSPVFSLHYDGGQVMFQGNGSNRSDCLWRGTIYINRRGHGNTNTELLAMQVMTALLQKVRDNVSGTNYVQVALAEQPIVPAFAEINGHPYRIVEFILESVTYDR